MSLSFSLFPTVRSSDVGQIAYFEIPCPENWSQYTKSAGRVLLSSGETVDTRGQSIMFYIEQKGGEYYHVQTVEEMANHNHRTGQGAWYHLYGGGEYHDSKVAPKGNYEFWYNPFTSSTGGGQPFNIQQPYLVLNCCIKTKDISLENSAIIAEMKIEIQNLRELLDKKKDISSDKSVSKAEMMKEIERLQGYIDDIKLNYDNSEENDSSIIISSMALACSILQTIFQIASYFYKINKKTPIQSQSPQHQMQQLQQKRHSLNNSQQGSNNGANYGFQQPKSK